MSKNSQGQDDGKRKKRMPEGGWPLLNDHPPMKEWHMVAEMADGAKYRVTVVARYREDACREIVHQQMAKWWDSCVRLIYEDKNKGENPPLVD